MTWKQTGSRLKCRALDVKNTYAFLKGRLFQLDDVIEAQQFDREILSAIFKVAREMEMIKKSCANQILKGFLMATLFYEPSTRTGLSFESAMKQLGGKVLTTENAREFSSAAKGEIHEGYEGSTWGWLCCSPNWYSFKNYCTGGHTEEYIGYAPKEDFKAQDRRSFDLLVIINPNLQKKGNNSALFFKGCLSVDGHRAMVERFLDVEVTGLDRYGQPIKVSASGWQTRILQHECDHLAGTLYVDKMVRRTFRTLYDSGPLVYLNTFGS